MHRDAWIVYMTRLQGDWRAYAQEFDQHLERGPDACVVDAFLNSLCTEWGKRGRSGW